MRTLIAALLLVLISSSALAQEPVMADRHGPGRHFLDSGFAARPAHKLVSVKRHKVAAKSKAIRRAPVSQVARTEPPVEVPLDVPAPDQPLAIAGILIEATQNIFKRFVESLVKPIGNCRAFDTVDVRVKTVVSDAAKHFGSPALATSCYRSPEHNQRVGGARRSQHMARKALDFKIAGVSPIALAKYVRQRGWRGGVGVYRWGIHVDSGPKRNWGRRFA